MIENKFLSFFLLLQKNLTIFLKQQGYVTSVRTIFKQSVDVAEPLFLLRRKFRQKFLE